MSPVLFISNLYTSNTTYAIENETRQFVSSKESVVNILQGGEINVILYSTRPPLAWSHRDIKTWKMDMSKYKVEQNERL